MILLDIKRYIKNAKEVSADDIRNRFDISQDTLDALITPLLKQGYIQKLTTASCGSKCGTSCASNSSKTLFRWMNKRTPNLLFPIEVH